ncbi:MAG TPA: hypothetical protein VLM75_16360 [Spirochaetota bacterium]|nr:hypothetical protein [Spirochaetota bacterium]
MNNTILTTALVIITLGLSSHVFAADIVLVGSTLGLDVKSMEGGRPVSTGRAELQALAARITDEYHRRGYTTSYVEKVSVRPDGAIEVRVIESRIAGASVSGVSEREAGEIRSLLVPAEGELYNRNALKERMDLARARFNLDSVVVRPLNYEGTGDVFLSVNVRRRSPGSFYGGIGVDPIYGIMPRIGWRLPFAPSSLDLKTTAGFRDRLRKAGGEARYTHTLGEGHSSFFIGADGGMTVERWEAPERDYAVKAGASILGMGFAADLPLSFLAWLNLYGRGQYSDVRDYTREGSSRTIRDLRGVADLLVTDRFYLLEKRDATSFSAVFSLGAGDLEPGGYFIAESRFCAPIRLFSIFRLIPRASSYYTDSRERFHMRYVFDGDLPGFAGDFSAARWKLVAGLDAEFEIVPSFLFAGPLVSGGRFLDEEERRRSATGLGLKAAIEHRGTMASVSYAWDASAGPSHGGVYIAAESLF